MRRPISLASLLIALALTGPIRAADDPRPGVDWPQFRGIRARGVAEGFPAPVRWNVETGENVKWKTAIPGLGHSSPIVWRDLVCVTTAISGKDDPVGAGIYVGIGSVADATAQRWEVHCLDKRTGATRWNALAHRGVPKVKRHSKSTHANPTLATDGRHLIALFGSEGLYGFDLEGRPLWKKDLGVLDAGYFVDPSAQWGFGGSPVIFGQLVIVQADVQRGSFLAAFDIRTGRERWRASREDVPTWSTPTVDASGGRIQVIVNGHRHMGGYDLKSGKELWRMRGGGDIPVPTPVVSRGLVYLTSAHGKGSPIYAVRTDAAGDVSLAGGAGSNQYVVWSEDGGSYIQTPLADGDYLYVARWNGVLNVYEAQTGRRVYQQRLGGGRSIFSASPVSAAGKIYVTSEDGSVFVVKAGAEFELLAENPMGEICLATPAISEGMLFFRTRGHVVAIGTPAG